MICEHCGTECVGSVPACKYDTLKTQLASMTKRVEDAERWRKHTLDVERMVDDLKVDLLAAEAKLATAAEGFVSIKSYLNDNPGKTALGVVTNRWVSDVCNYALHALGIDPSKETL